MSELQPRGVPITIGGKERRFLFTLSAVDEVQNEFGLPVSEVIEKLANNNEIIDTASRIALILLNGDIERDRKKNNSDEPLWTETELKDEIDITMLGMLVRTILKSYGYSIPDLEEDEDPNA